MEVLVIGGQRAMLGYLRPYLLTLRLGLFVNDWMPEIPDTITDLTEASYVGYARQNVVDWGAVYTNLSGQAETAAGPYTFQVTSPGPSQSVYGYFLADPSGNLILAERNDAGPQSMSSVGATFVVIPRFLLTSFALAAYSWSSEGGGFGGGSATL